MFNVDNLKDQLIEGLWFSVVKEAGSAFYSRRKNKRMKLFTLTNGINFKEILKFEEEKLIQRADIVAWVVTDYNKRMRLEVESLGCILDGDILTEPILDTSSQLQSHFPCDIINLDFSSQGPNIRSGRVECEIECLEKNINLQNRRDGRRFVLIYTSIIDSNSINRDNIVQASNAFQISGWRGLNLTIFPQNISDPNQQKAFIEEAITKICQKYGYSKVRFNNSALAIPGHQEQLYSIGGIIER